MKADQYHQQLKVRWGTNRTWAFGEWKRRKEVANESSGVNVHLHPSVASIFHHSTFPLWKLFSLWISDCLYLSPMCKCAICPRGMENTALTYHKLSQGGSFALRLKWHTYSDMPILIRCPHPYKHRHWRHRSSSCCVSQTGMQKCMNFVVGFSFFAILISPINSHSTLMLGLPTLFSVANISRLHWVLSWGSMHSHWCDSAWPCSQILLNSFVGLEVEEGYIVSWICFIS